MTPTHAPSRIFVVLAAVLSGCATDATFKANVVAFTATDYAIEVPDSIPSGWTTLQLANHGQEIHYGHIAQLEGGRTTEDLLAAYEEAIRTSGPRPKWVLRFGGPGGIAPGGTSSVTQYLEPGSYVWICPIEDESGHPHFAKGEFARFVVHASDAAGAARAPGPKADIDIRLMDFSFAVDSVLGAGRHVVRVENDGVEPHDLVLMKLAPGKTLQELMTTMNPERARRDPTDEPPPPLESLGTLVGGIAVIASGMEAFFEVELTPGDYVVICMTTAPDGRSHVEHGMIRQVRVQ